jgi:hypothetical protein
LPRAWIHEGPNRAADLDGEERADEGSRKNRPDQRDSAYLPADEPDDEGSGSSRHKLHPDQKRECLE